uniref:J domain-containing protein n=1 Tax=Rhizophora mucronata TaxID=61149 RepID=A0A2P2KQG4_RHIMU
MDPDVDHYRVLGLPSGEEGAKLTEKEISKAYKLKALELHPDKRPDDPDAHANFQKLKSSYEILKDEKARKLFDDLLRVKREQEIRRSQQGAKRQKMVSDLEERERMAFAPDPAAKAREEEERISRKLKEEIARIIAMSAKKAAPATPASKRETAGMAKEKITDTEKEKMLKVSWEKVGEDYTAESLRELFAKFGGVEDVVIKSSKKKGSALVVMATKEAAVAATGSISGNLSNPLLVLPLQSSSAAEFSYVQRSSESDHVDHLVGAGYKAYEDSILDKLLKAAASQKKK